MENQGGNAQHPRPDEQAFTRQAFGQPARQHRARRNRQIDNGQIDSGHGGGRAELGGVKGQKGHKPATYEKNDEIAKKQVK